MTGEHGSFVRSGGIAYLSRWRGVASIASLVLSFASAASAQSNAIPFQVNDPGGLIKENVDRARALGYRFAPAPPAIDNVQPGPTPTPTPASDPGRMSQLSGAYSFVLQGFVSRLPDRVPVAYTGTIVLDGRGNATSISMTTRQDGSQPWEGTCEPGSAYGDCGLFSVRSNGAGSLVVVVVNTIGTFATADVHILTMAIAIGEGGNRVVAQITGHEVLSGFASFATSNINMLETASGELIRQN